MKADVGEIARYGVNGLVATAVHYLVLSVSMDVLGIASAALASVGASAAGIMTSFIGSRYFVFKARREMVVPQLMKFGGVYIVVAGVHATTLLILSDWIGASYTIGFLVATGIQVSCSFVGNRKWVFVR